MNTAQLNKKEEPSDYLIEAIKEVNDCRDRGDACFFNDPKDALRFLDKIIDDKIDL